MNQEKIGKFISLRRKISIKKIISEYLILYTDISELEHHIQKEEDHMKVRGTLLSKSSSRYKRDMFGISVYLYEKLQDILLEN